MAHVWHVTHNVWHVTHVTYNVWHTYGTLLITCGTLLTLLITYGTLLITYGMLTKLRIVLSELLAREINVSWMATKPSTSSWYLNCNAKTVASL